ncbi:MAG TPA: heparan-alpha-glucosaminide N-acetyltransferase domain-containing protein, partial [Candidatus Thermoplasmatota archaeon]|nr:heparan-alpha-glucosaminide N-acetyltransferase domain-containing protein [Candidatus Thermoplasmatota archaeon]
MRLKKADGRLWEIDFIRGIAIILMIAFHFIYDLNHYKIIYYKLWTGPFAIAA